MWPALGLNLTASYFGPQLATDIYRDFSDGRFSRVRTVQRDHTPLTH